MPDIELVVDARYELGEGPVWDPVDGVLFWVNSLDPRLGPSVNRYDPRDRAVKAWPLPHDIGSMALRERGGAVLALRNGFHTFDFDSGQCELIVEVEADQPRTRLNDGKCDRCGRFFAGGMDQHESDYISGLYRLDPDMTVTKVADGFQCFNMPCWSPDDRTFYCAETWETIWAYDYDIEAGAISNKRALVDLRGEPGGCDGSTVDEEGYIWNAQVVSGRLIRYAPDGTIDRDIPFPIRNLTSVMFGGDNLDVLYVTSLARVVHPPHGHFVKEAGPEPTAGGLFEVRGLGVRGLPEPRFAG